MSCGSAAKKDGKRSGKVGISTVGEGRHALPRVRGSEMVVVCVDCCVEVSTATLMWRDHLIVLGLITEKRSRMKMLQILTAETLILVNDCLFLTIFSANWSVIGYDVAPLQRCSSLCISCQTCCKQFSFTIFHSSSLPQTLLTAAIDHSLAPSILEARVLFHYQRLPTNQPSAY